MAIEIINVVEYEFAGNSYRHADIAIIDNGNEYKLGVGGLPLAGDLQTTLDGREAELLALAVAKGATFDVFNSRERELLKAFAFVVLDEINRLTEKVNELNNGLDVIGGRVNKILDAADNATSLADFKARMGAINDLPTGAIDDLSLRNESQIRGAIKSNLTAALVAE